ncbi:MAG: hypothetical protein ACI9LX_000714 [Paraglaciecola sp.]|jgi:hypothetical protein
MNIQKWRVVSIILATFIFTNSTVFAKQAPLVSIPTHDAFFSSIAKHCGKAFEGEVVVDNQPSPAFDAKLVMFVRKCDQAELQIPFYVGDNASRTWIIKKTGSGLSLKHDHRLKNGTDDPVTMYGGHTRGAGYKQIQSFPVDQYSKELFTKQGLPQSITNTWQVYIYPEMFSYRLVREGREFRVDFDLTKPIPVPDAPWGYKD